MRNVARARAILPRLIRFLLSDFEAPMNRAWRRNPCEPSRDARQRDAQPHGERPQRRQRRNPTAAQTPAPGSWYPASARGVILQEPVRLRSNRGAWCPAPRGVPQPRQAQRFSLPNHPPLLFSGRLLRPRRRCSIRSRIPLIRGHSARSSPRRRPRERPPA
jgi:hypothetical protein